MITASIWWLFLLVAPVAYWLLPERLRAGALALASIALIGWFAPIGVAVMIGVTALVFAAYRGAERDEAPGLLARLGRSRVLVWAVFLYFVLGKGLPQLLSALAGQQSAFSLTVPLGLSYFSFKVLHYSLEMRRRAFPPHRLDDFACWMFLAPIFTAGPIERFEHFLSQRATRFDARLVGEGLLRIGEGLVKKFVLAAIVLDQLEKVNRDGVVGLVGSLDTASPLTIWAFLSLSLLYIYLDFAAYSDIAIGSARLFGLRIMENFNFPLLATSLNAFWQRWHMTLAGFVRHYVYLPVIGLTRNPYLAGIVTFSAMGLWHQFWPAQWLLWGTWHGLGLAGLLYWSQFRMKRKIRLGDTVALRAAGWAGTMAWVSLGAAFTVTYGKLPVTDSFRLIGAAFGLK